MIVNFREIGFAIGTYPFSEPSGTPVTKVGLKDSCQRLSYLEVPKGDVHHCHSFTVLPEP